MRAPVDAIAGLRERLKAYRAMGPAMVEAKVAAAGFRCRRCAKCCQGRFGDNTVTVFPGEVRAIMEAAGLGWLDVARPHESDDADAEGVVHTFEWTLRKKENGDCVFLEGGACAVYEQRPLVCRTYPMRLEGDELELYECDGLGSGAPDDAAGMAAGLVRRQVAEAAESLALLEKFAARRSHAAPASGRVFEVHDGEGSRLVAERPDGTFYFL